MESIQNVSFYNPPEIDLMKQKLSTIPVNTKDLTALSNNTYVYDTPFQIKTRLYNTSTREAETTGIITFPSTPSDGDFITLVDSANVFGGEVDTVRYSTVVITINFNGKVCKGDFSDGNLLPARKGQVTFKFSTALNQWTSFLLTQDDISSDDPWTGYWTPLTYCSQSWDDTDSVGVSRVNSSLIYLDATKNPVQQYFFEGTPDKPHSIYSQGYNKSKVPLISVTGTNVMTGSGGTLKALVRFNDPTFGINQPDQWEQSSYGRFVLDPDDPTIMYYYSTRADFFHFYTGDQQWCNAVYKKCSGAIPYIKHFGPEDQQVYSYGDPVVLFDWFFDQLTKNTNANNNSCQNKSFYGDSYKIKSFLESVKKDGFTVTVPIKSIVGGVSTISTVFNTKENCHYCPIGSNITISGFLGAYATLNGYYPNGVNRLHNYFQSYLNSGTMDYNLTNGIATGSVFENMNKFCISLNTSNSTTYPRITTPGAANYGQAIFTGNPVVTVTHKVHSDMTYNEWCAACCAVAIKIFGSLTHTSSSVLTSNYKAYSSWNTNPFSPTTTAGNNMRSGLPSSHMYVSNYGENYEPYYAQTKLNTLISSDSNLNYGGRITSSITQIPLYNYLATGTVANQWYAMDKPYTGPYANTWQQSKGINIGSKNLSDPSLIGGSQFVCEMKPYPYSTGSALPDLYTWNLNAATSNNGKTTLASMLSAVYSGIGATYCGLIRPDLVASLGYGTKRVAYFRMPNIRFVYDRPNKYVYEGIAGLFNTPVTESYQHTGVLGSLYFTSALTRYINGETGAGGLGGADALIIDSRDGQGGPHSNVFYPFFGGDRKGFIYETPISDNGYGPLMNLQTSPDIVNSNQLYADFHARISPTDMERLFPGSVFKGTPEAPKKIVILTDVNARSASDEWIHGWFGDNYDGNLGGNVTCSFLGDCDGRLAGGSGGTKFPVDFFSKSYFINVNSKLNCEVATSFKKHLATGPISGGVYQHSAYPETYIRGMSAGATGTLKSVSGNKCFPNSFETGIYQDWGYIPKSPANRWIPQDRPEPNPDNFYTYRDAWLENAIREALYQPPL